MVSIMDLPAEILSQIFQFYLKSESQRQLLLNVTRVCRYWQDVSMNNSSLWTKCDGTVSFNQMMKLCQKGCLNNTKELVISSTKTLKQQDGIKLFTNVANVEMINFSNVEHAERKTFLLIAEHCSKLKEIKIGEHRNVQMKLSASVLDAFFASRGPNLTTVQFSNCCLGNVKSVLPRLSECCPNLEELHLTNLGINGGSFPTKRFQKQCPKLKKLHMDGSIGVNADKYSSGFPDLEVFTYVECGVHRMTDRQIDCVLFDSSNLKFLNLTNCDVTPEALYQLPAASVEYLFVPRSKICNVKGLDDVLKKWSRTLRQVDISYSNYVGINRAVRGLLESPTHAPQLQYLNLSFTKVMADAVESILHSCPRLEVLHLEGCRSLERGMKKTYSGKSEFKLLRKKIRAFLAANPKETMEID